MSGYEIVFEGGTEAPSRVPEVGETVEIAGSLWDVESIDGSDVDCPRVHLVQHVGDEADFEAHRRLPPPVSLAAPTSFESELVYTLNDLATRLSTLARVLTAYWGKGAA
jgi:hypothetical protein